MDLVARVCLFRLPSEIPPLGWLQQQKSVYFQKRQPSHQALVVGSGEGTLSFLCQDRQ